MDEIIVDEETREILVKDDFGMHIMYDCALDDLSNLDEDLLKTGTYYVRKNED